jgi:hypothetical protein
VHCRFPGFRPGAAAQSGIAAIDCMRQSCAENIASIANAFCFFRRRGRGSAEEIFRTRNKSGATRKPAAPGTRQGSLVTYFFFFLAFFFAAMVSSCVVRPVAGSDDNLPLR